MEWEKTVRENLAGLLVWSDLNFLLGKGSKTHMISRFPWIYTYFELFIVSYRNVRFPQSLHRCSPQGKANFPVYHTKLTS